MKSDSIRAHGALTPDRLRQLRDHYLSLLQLEVEELGVAPAEVRHLIGRLGELECALLVGGTLSHRANQHGFDVIAANGRKISVKSTCQISGFVAISKSTYHHANDLMVIQYQNSELKVLYYGCINKAVEAARFYARDNKYEFNLSKARQLQHAIDQSVQANSNAIRANDCLPSAIVSQ